MTSLFPFVKKKPELFLRIISLAHAPMNVTDVSIGSINCDQNNADKRTQYYSSYINCVRHFLQAYV